MKPQQGFVLVLWLVIGANSWKIVGNIPASQPYTGFCSAAMQIDGLNYVLTFGGKENSISSNRLYITNIADNTTKSVVGPFSARSGSCCCANSQMFYVFGGVDQNNNPNSEFWAFDFVRNSWLNLPLSTANNSALSQFARPSCSLICTPALLFIIGNNNTPTTSPILSLNLQSHLLTQQPIKTLANIKVQNTLWDGTTETVLLYGQQEGVQGEMVFNDQTHATWIGGVIQAGRVDEDRILVKTNQGVFGYNIANGYYRQLEDVEFGGDCVMGVVSGYGIDVCPWGMGFTDTKNQYLINSSNISSEQWPSLSPFSSLSNLSNDLYLVTPTSIYFLSSSVCSTLTPNTVSCFYGWPICQVNYTGAYCQQPACPNTFIYYGVFETIVYQCSGHGYCSNGRCVCSREYTGESCEVYRKLECKGEVIGQYPMEICQCNDQTIAGNNCQVRLCYNDCGGAGECQEDGGCQCQDSFTGPDCSIYIIPMNFVYASRAIGMLLCVIFLLL